MERAVLDSSALLAMLFNEPGGEAVAPYLPFAVMSAVNCTEVVTKQIRWGADPRFIPSLLAELNIEVIPWDAEFVAAAADLSPLAWIHGLSIGDRACLATARHLKLPLVTAERMWPQLPNLGIDICVIR